MDRMDRWGFCLPMASAGFSVFSPTII